MLNEKIARAEQIVADQRRTKHQKDMELAKLMSEMEGQYQIPAMQNPEWEAAHPDVIKTYRQISDMRSI